MSPEFQSYHEAGWCRFSFDSSLKSWIDHALPVARSTRTDPDFAQWWRCQDTWFAGVNVLPNDTAGKLIDGPPLAGLAIDFIAHELQFSDIHWDKAQISICKQGYPKQDYNETEAAHLYRLNRDSAHVDGLHREGPDRRRFLREHHAFVLGIPFAKTDAGAAPFVVWEGSHIMVKNALSDALGNHGPKDWHRIDLTDVYHQVRRDIFETCKRVEVPALPGEAYIIHRHALHGVAPWAKGAQAGPDDRMICYFRPDIGNLENWIDK